MDQVSILIVTRLLEWGLPGVVLTVLFGIIWWLIRANNEQKQTIKEYLAVINRMHERRAEAITKNAQVMMGASAAQIKSAEALRQLAEKIEVLIQDKGKR